MHRIVWLILLAISVVGGWYSGRHYQSQRQYVDSAGTEDSLQPDRNAKSVFPTGSPRALWMECVKNAEASDFPQIDIDWNDAFPKDERYEEYYARNALNAFRWMMGVWLVKDSDGFLKEAESFYFTHIPGEVTVDLMPEKAEEWLSKSLNEKINQWFVGSLSSELAKKYPERYLKMNPDCTVDYTPGMSNDDWQTAIASWVKTDALAAGNACLNWKVDNHAWLSALAEKDPKVALKKLNQVELEQENDLQESAPRKILKELAKKYPVEALRLLKDVEEIFVQSPGLGYDPFDEAPAEKKAPPQ